MQRRIEEILKEIQEHPARSAWDRGVRQYAEELFREYVIEGLHIRDVKIRIGKIDEKVLLNGARDWEQYSYGGCALAYDEEICERLCPPSFQKKKCGGALPPAPGETWLDWQTRALRQAARVVVRAVNRR